MFKGAKIFKAEEVEDSELFNHSDMSDKMNDIQAKIPNYEPLITKKCKGLRKTLTTPFRKLITY